MKQVINPVLRQPKSIGILPVWDKDCKILLLGSITAVDGMRKGFYYGSHVSQFWHLVDLSLELNSLDEDSFVYLKNLLKDNYEKFKSNLIDTKEFEKNKKLIKQKFAEKLLKYNIAICDVFEECYFNNNSSLDNEIILNNPNYPCKYNNEIISHILNNSKIKTVIVNSKFVESQFKKMKIVGDFEVKYVISPSPRRGKIEKKIDCWKKAIGQGLKNF